MFSFLGLESPEQKKRREAALVGGSNSLFG